METTKHESTPKPGMYKIGQLALPGRSFLIIAVLGLVLVSTVGSFFNTAKNGDSAADILFSGQAASFLLLLIWALVVYRAISKGTVAHNMLAVRVGLLAFVVGHFVANILTLFL